jgi:hypothetical protein
MGSYSDFNRPILESPAEVDRQFNEALAKIKREHRELTEEDIWSQRSTPRVGCRPEDFAPGDDLPNSAAVARTHRRLHGGLDGTRRLSDQWNGGSR